MSANQDTLSTYIKLKAKYETTDIIKQVSWRASDLQKMYSRLRPFSVSKKDLAKIFQYDPGRQTRNVYLGTCFLVGERAGERIGELRPEMDEIIAATQLVVQFYDTENLIDHPAKPELFQVIPSDRYHAYRDAKTSLEYIIPDDLLDRLLESMVEFHTSTELAPILQKNRYKALPALIWMDFELYEMGHLRAVQANDGKIRFEHTGIAVGDRHFKGLLTNERVIESLLQKCDEMLEDFDLETVENMTLEEIIESFKEEARNEYEAGKEIKICPDCHKQMVPVKDSMKATDTTTVTDVPMLKCESCSRTIPALFAEMEINGLVQQMLQKGEQPEVIPFPAR